MTDGAFPLAAPRGLAVSGQAPSEVEFGVVEVAPAVSACRDRTESPTERPAGGTSRWSEPDVGSGFVAAHDDMPMLFGRVDFRLWSPDGTRWFA